MYPTQAGTSGPTSASESGSSFFAKLFILFFTAITPSSPTFQIWWFGSGSVDFFFLNAIFTDFDFFLASFIGVRQFHTHLWKIWALRSKYKISANI